jgi:hypothetical protein
MKVDVMCCFHQFHDTHRRFPIACTHHFFLELSPPLREKTIHHSPSHLAPHFCLWSITLSPVLYNFLNSRVNFWT